MHFLTFDNFVKFKLKAVRKVFIFSESVVDLQITYTREFLSCFYVLNDFIYKIVSILMYLIYNVAFKIMYVFILL